mmetsp:Transcript_142360/g.361476  ORF Transcript_142360/g.361476 Transcript_142360/m.361476 type:complete len:333 (-) Transcript_142360:578-1576(-)
MHWHPSCPLRRCRRQPQRRWRRHTPRRAWRRERWRQRQRRWGKLRPGEGPVALPPQPLLWPQALARRRRLRWRLHYHHRHRRPLEEEPRGREGESPSAGGPEHPPTTRQRWHCHHQHWYGPQGLDSWADRPRQLLMLGCGPQDLHATLEPLQMMAEVPPRRCQLHLVLLAQQRLSPYRAPRPLCCCLWSHRLLGCQVLQRPSHHRRLLLLLLPLLSLVLQLGPHRWHWRQHPCRPALKKAVMLQQQRPVPEPSAATFPPTLERMPQDPKHEREEHLRPHLRHHPVAQYSDHRCLDLCCPHRCCYHRHHCRLGWDPVHRQHIFSPGADLKNAR